VSKSAFFSHLQIKCQLGICIILYLNRFSEKNYGCGDFAVLAVFYKILEKLQIPHEKIVTIAGIGCSSRFPYFVNSHGIHFIHGRALPLATGVSLSRPDVHVFAFGGDGDGFSIGGNHLEHCARKNPNITYVIMDNFVYGLTKKQTSPTSPIGYKSKTDPTGAVEGRRPRTRTRFRSPRSRGA